jgi:hypothetical protein
LPVFYSSRHTPCACYFVRACYFVPATFAGRVKSTRSCPFVPVLQGDARPVPFDKPFHVWFHFAVGTGLIET